MGNTFPADDNTCQVRLESHYRLCFDRNQSQDLCTRRLLSLNGLELCGYGCV